jgi:ATP-dependent protease HslVU (ClpYQ) peptidase subunit
MTTIATDGRSMAADGRVCAGATIFGSNAKKIIRLADGRICGCAGNSRYQAPFVAWLANGGDLPEMDDEFEALVLMPDGTVVSYDHKGRSLPEELPTASGSGREFALAAMDLGASPEEAVKAACARDTMSGGEITVLELPPLLKVVGQ